MTKLRNALYSSLAVPLIFYGCSNNQKTSDEKKQGVETTNKVMILKTPPPEIYDTKTEMFLEKKGGIDEKVINEYIKYFDKSDAPFYKTVDSVEETSKFYETKENDGILSELGMYVNMIHNFRIIKEADEAKIEDLKKEYAPLKKLLIRLDRIHEKDPRDNYEEFEKMYDLIGRDVDPSYKKTDIGVEEVISGKGGVCRDIVAAYYPLLAYYGFDVSFKEGGIGKALHVWLHARIKDKEFDLDPTWYAPMIPLEDRIGNSCEVHVLKDKFTTRR
jgi:hypothetical protein